MFQFNVPIVNADLGMLDAHAHVMQVKLCKANTRGVTANAHHFTLRAAGVYEDLLGALHWLKRPSQPLGVECFFGDLLPDGRELFGGDYCHGVFTAVDLALIGSLEGGADGDDRARTRHLQL